MVNLFSLFSVCQQWSFLGLKPWYAYLKVQPDSTGACNVVLTGANDILLVLLAIIDDMLIVAGLVAVIFVIYGGIRYITSQGEPSETAKAQSTLIYALVGLAIAIIAIPTVSYLGNTLGTGNGAKVPVAVGSTTTLNLNTLPNPTGAVNGDLLGTILQITFGIIGAMTLIFVIIGGLRYIFSSGDPQAAATAKGTVIYALVGLIVTIVAYSIVSLVIGRIK